MKILLALIAISLLVACGFLAAFFWAVRSGQYEDEYTPSMRMLFDHEKPSDQTEEQANNDELGGGSGFAAKKN